MICRERRHWLAAMLLSIAWLACHVASAQQRSDAEEPRVDPGSAAMISTSHDATDLPEAPEPQGDLAIFAEAALATAGPPQRQTAPGFPPASPEPRVVPRSQRPRSDIPSEAPQCLADICTAIPARMSCSVKTSDFQRFLDSVPHPLNAKQKGYLALRNFTDPYNFATIAFLSGISVATDPNSAYGPGLPGFLRNFGVASCETAIGEFFGTFLLPAVTHEDPHYHRIPNASFARRSLHAITQVVWTQSDYGTNMLNYSNLVTPAASIALGALYIPGQVNDAQTQAIRYVTAVATSPIGNFITEFLPDVASRVNVRIVLFQRIIDRIQKENGGS